MLLREMLFDASGSVKPARMSAVLNAALGYVAEQTDGFVNFDAVPADGAPLQACQQHHKNHTLAWTLNALQARLELASSQIVVKPSCGGQSGGQCIQ